MLMCRWTVWGGGKGGIVNKSFKRNFSISGMGKKIVKTQTLFRTIQGGFVRDLSLFHGLKRYIDPSKRGGRPCHKNFLSNKIDRIVGRGGGPRNLSLGTYQIFFITEQNIFSFTI